MGCGGEEIFLHLVQIDVIGRHIRKQQVLVAVVNVKQRRALLPFLQGQRKLCPEAVPGIVNNVNGNIRMNLHVGFCHLSEQVRRIPEPPFQRHRLAVVYQVVGIVGNMVPHHFQPFVRLGVHNPFRMLSGGFGAASAQGQDQNRRQAGRPQFLFHVHPSICLFLC